MDVSAAPVRLALAGGGTGGHILPGVHLVRHALTRGALQDLVWFQTGRSVEDAAMSAFVAELGGRVPFERRILRLEPLSGGAPTTATLAARTPAAFFAARRALARHRSDVLLGLGGYTSLPAVLAARSLGITVALLEINAVGGRATRWLSPRADRVFHAWPGSLPPDTPGHPGERDLWTGPPLAAEFERSGQDLDGDPAARRRLGFDPQRPLLLVLGGSQGARSLNRFAREHVDVFRERGLQLLHQTGPGRGAEAAPGSSDCRAVEYVADVAEALRAATFVLCRGGASTLAEVGALHRPAWVVPYPHHPDRHQERNAHQLEPGVRVVPESELDREHARELARLCGVAGREARAAMALALAGRVPSDGARRIWNELERIGARPRRAPKPQRGLESRRARA